MQVILNEHNIRKQEAQNYICFVEELESEEYVTSNIQSNINLILLRTSMKSSILLMHYNVVESTMTKCLKKIHEAIKQGCLYYSQLNDHIKKIILLYYENAMSQNVNAHKIVDFRIKQLELIQGQSYFELSYDELIEYYPMYNGNLDAKQVRKILGRYGIIFEDESTELKTIKQYRNQLAHGEMSFEEVGRTVSLQQLWAIHNNVFSFLEKVIEAVSLYLCNESYKQCSNL